MNQRAVHRRELCRIPLFVVAGLAGVGLLGGGLWTAGALRAVDAVERERDRWQRPAQVLDALDLREGDVVADVGSGVGYFALKLSKRVGRDGRVLAVDVRSFPLLFLRLRALLRGCSNLSLVRGEAGNPHLPAGGVDAILVANTLHELEDPDAVLSRLREALRPGGRLVVLDPAPGVTEPGPPRGPAHHHSFPDRAEGRIRAAGLEVLGRDDVFVEAPGHGRWWLVVARRPADGGEGGSGRRTFLTPP